MMLVWMLVAILWLTSWFTRWSEWWFMSWFMRWLMRWFISWFQCYFFWSWYISWFEWWFMRWLMSWSEWWFTSWFMRWLMSWFVRWLMRWFMRWFMRWSEWWSRWYWTTREVHLTRAAFIIPASLPKFIGAATSGECIGDRRTVRRITVVGVRIGIAIGQLFISGWIIKTQKGISIVTAWRTSCHINGIARACCDWTGSIVLHGVVSVWCWVCWAISWRSWGKWDRWRSRGRGNGWINADRG